MIEREAAPIERCRLLTVRHSSPRPALFLDRDGVIIEDRHHLHDPEQVQLCAGASALIAAAHRAGWPVVVITNQSGIARGLFSWHDYERVSERMLLLLGPDAPIAALYANGHGPDAPLHSWRKPSPVMLQQAAAALGLDLPRSLLVGDRLSDLRAGAAAGVAAVCHVLSGHGLREREAVERWAAHPAASPASAQPAPHPAAGSSRQGEGQCAPCQPRVVLLSSLDSFPFELLATDGAAAHEGQQAASAGVRS